MKLTYCLGNLLSLPDMSVLGAVSAMAFVVVYVVKDLGCTEPDHFLRHIKDTLLENVERFCADPSCIAGT